MSDRLLHRISEQGDRARIPALDHAINAGEEDGVLGQFDDGGDQRSEFIGAIRLGHYQSPYLINPRVQSVLAE